LILGETFEVILILGNVRFDRLNITVVSLDSLFFLLSLVEELLFFLLLLSFHYVVVIDEAHQVEMISFQLLV
jgi:hypothetical protein